MTKTKKWLLLFSISFGYQGIYGAVYLISANYSLYEHGMGLSPVQIGTLMGVFGITSTISYLLGGILADKFKPKALVCLALFVAGTVLAAMATLPNYKWMLILQIMLSLDAAFVFWGAMAKFIRSLGGPEEEGRLFGWFNAIMAVAGALIGFIVTYIVANSGATLGLRAILLLHAAFNYIPALIILFTYKNQKQVESKTPDEGKFEWKYVLYILKMPDVWLMSIMGFAGYISYLAMSYFSPLLDSQFGVSVALITLISTLRLQVVRAIIAPFTGILIDKLKSTTRIMVYMLILFTASLIVILVMPWGPSTAGLAITIVMLIAILYAASAGCWLTPASEIGIPNKMKGTAIGLSCAIMYSSDAFGYVVCGNIITKYIEAGNEAGGYKVIFVLCAVVALIGLAATLILRKRLKYKKHASNDKVIAAQ